MKYVVGIFVLMIATSSKAATPLEIYNSCVASAQAQSAQCNGQTHGCGAGPNGPICSYWQSFSRIEASNDSNIVFYAVLGCQVTEQGNTLETRTYCGFPKSAVSSAPPVVANQNSADFSRPIRQPTIKCGSVLNLQDRSYGESVPLSGSPLRLSYQSKYDPARASNTKVSFRYDFSEPDPVTRKITLKLDGQTVASTPYPPINTIIYNNVITDQMLPTPNPFILSAHVELQVAATYSYSTGIGDVTASGEVPLTASTATIQAYKPAVWGLGGWTLDIHHYYDPKTKMIFFGNGSRRQADLPLKDFPAYGLVYMGTDDSGSEVYLFDHLGRHLETKTPLIGATKWKFEYLADHKIHKVYDRDGLATEVLRDSNGQATGIKAPFGQVTQLEINDNKLIEVTDATGATHEMGYANNGMLSAISYPSGLETQFEVDSDGLFLRETKNTGGFQGLVSSVLNGVKSYVFSSSVAVSDNIATTQTATNEKTTNKNTTGQTINEVEFTATQEKNTSSYASTTTNITSDARFGNLVRKPSSVQLTLQANGTINQSQNFTQSVTYQDGTGPFNIAQLTETSTLNGKTTQAVFDGVNKTLTVTSPLGKSNRYFLDEKERITKIETLGNADTTLTYQSNGLLQSFKQGARLWSYEYDANGFVRKETQPSGKFTLFERNGNGQVTKKTSPNGDTVRFEYSNSGELEKITAPNNAVHEFQPTLLGQLAQYLPPALGGMSHQTVYSYDTEGRLLKIQKPSGKFAEYHYKSGTDFVERIATDAGDYVFENLDVYGRPASVTSPDGIRMETQWMMDQILHQKTFDGVRSLSPITYTYDSFLRPQNLAVGNYSFPYEYDDEGLLVRAGEETYFNNRVTNRSTGLSFGTRLIIGYLGQTESQLQWNEQDNASDPDGYKSRYFALIRSIVTGGNTVRRHAVESREDFDGNSDYLTQEQTYYNGALTTSDQTFDRYTYDANNRLIEVRHQDQDYANGQTQSTPLMLISQYTFGAGSNNNIKTYNHSNKVTQATYDDQDRLTTLTGAINRDFTYTADGDLEGIENCLGKKSFEYDVFGNLKKVTLTNGKVITYKIDGFNRRVAKYVNGQPHEYYVWQDQYRLSQVLTGSGVTKYTYVYGPLGLTPMYMINWSDGKKYKIVANHRGDIRYVTDLDGNLIQQIDYDEYGMVLKDSSMTTANQSPLQVLGFAGGLYDHETGLVRFGARDYDPSVGRWNTKDPIGFAGGDTNLYSYVGQNPTSYTDPTGLAKCTYSISSHTLICTSNDGKQIINVGPEGVFSGNGLNQNSTSAQFVPNAGPIPTGNYGITADERAKGFWKLSPDLATRILNLGLRSGFQLHPGTRSEGCITVDKRNPASKRQYELLNQLLIKEATEGNHLNVAK